MARMIGANETGGGRLGGNGNGSNARARLGVDIGGTFTDVALEAQGALVTAKVLTTQDAPERGVLDAVAAALVKASVEPGQVELIIHGTTLATNALIERRGAKTAFITTEGFRDVLEMGSESRFDQYDLNIEKPEPLVPRDLRLTVPERLSAEGDVLVPLEEDALRAHLQTLDQAEVESVAIGFLHAWRHPDHEERAAEILRTERPDLSVTASADVAPEIREYERFTTACANAYVQPMMARYLRDLEEKLRGAGFACPLFLMHSGGGLIELDTAVRYPVRLVESGPAGGAILAADLAARLGLDKVVSFDMGGTTAKLCMIDDGRPQTARSFEVARAYRFKPGSGLPLRIPVIEMIEIGAGGGSIARVDAMRRIQVGPESAGSEPGPACYGRGGERATVTDANLVLGRIDPARFSGGALRLDADAAQAAVIRGVGGALDNDAVLAAAGIVEVVDENMANAAREHATERGLGLDGRTLIAFGGSAPLHAARIAGKLGIDRIVVPVSASVGSAVGFLRAPVAYEVARTGRQLLGRFDAGAANAVLDALSREASQIVARGAPKAERRETRYAYMRYLGQGHEIRVPLPVRPFKASDGVELKAVYDRSYAEKYGRLIDGVDVEVIGWAVAVESVLPAPERAGRARERAAGEPGNIRDLFDPATGDTLAVPIYWRDDLAPGASLEGPAVIAEDLTTTIVPGGFRSTVDAIGNIHLTRAPGVTP